MTSLQAAALTGAAHGALWDAAAAAVVVDIMIEDVNDVESDR